MLCRDSASSPGADPFDRPLSSRFDEQDAVVLFDDVVIPDRCLFLDGDVTIDNGIGATGVGDNMTSQSTIRALNKLDFAYGLGARMAEAINDRSPAILELLGELLGYVEVTRNAVLLSAEHGRETPGGVLFPDSRALTPMRAPAGHLVPPCQRDPDAHAHRQPQPAGNAAPPPTQ